MWANYTGNKCDAHQLFDNGFPYIPGPVTIGRFGGMN